MTEIEFRAISIETKEFVFGQLFYSYGTGTWKITCGNGWTPSYNNPDEGESTVYHDIDYDTIGQYIGLTDIRGVKIYSGDIGVRYLDGRKIYTDGKTWRDYWEIEWLDKCACFSSTKVAEYNVQFNKVFACEREQNRYSARFDELEIIGNIHQNEDLLSWN